MVYEYPQIDPATNANMVTTFSFNITIKHPCEDTLLQDRTVTDMTAQVSKSPTLPAQDFGAFTDSVSTSKGDPTYCGNRSYSISPDPFYLTLSGT